MIIESIVLGLTTVIVSSLVFANSLVKKQRQWDLEDSAPDETNQPDVVIEPWVFVRAGTGDEGTRCIKCNVCTRNSTKTEPQYGLFQPKVCLIDKCPASPAPHLHVECGTCNGRWFMHTADYKPKR